MSQQNTGPFKSSRRVPATKGQNNPYSSNTKTTDTAVIHTRKAGGPDQRLTSSEQVKFSQLIMELQHKIKSFQAGSV